MRKTDFSFLLFFYGEKVEGVYGVSVDSYFVVAVGTCAVSRASHESYDRAFFYFLSFLYEDDGVMPVAGGDAVAVFYFYQVAVTADPAGLCDDSVCRCGNGISVVTGYIDAFVESGAVAEGGLPVAVVAGNISFCRPYVGSVGFCVVNGVKGPAGLVHDFRTEGNNEFELFIQSFVKTEHFF